MINDLEKEFKQRYIRNVRNAEYEQETEYDNKFADMRNELCRELKDNMPFDEQISNAKLWGLFKEFCQKDLATDKEFQNNLALMSLFYFFVNRCKTLYAEKRQNRGV